MEEGEGNEGSRGKGIPVKRMVSSREVVLVREKKVPPESQNKLAAVIATVHTGKLSTDWLKIPGAWGSSKSLNLSLERPSRYSPYRYRWELHLPTAILTAGLPYGYGPTLGELQSVLHDLPLGLSCSNCHCQVPSLSSAEYRSWGCNELLCGCERRVPCAQHVQALVVIFFKRKKCKEGWIIDL